MAIKIMCGKVTCACCLISFFPNMKRVNKLGIKKTSHPSISSCHIVLYRVVHFFILLRIPIASYISSIYPNHNSSTVIFFRLSSKASFVIDNRSPNEFSSCLYDASNPSIEP